jgi:hypothetical protein
LRCVGLPPKAFVVAPAKLARSELAESTRGELASYVKVKTDEILGLNNIIARLKKEVEGYAAEAQMQVDASILNSIDSIVNRCN